MKTIIITLALSLSANAMAVCGLTMKQKTPSSTSAYLSGVSFSAKQLKALKEHCTIYIRGLTKEEKMKAYEEKLDREEADMKEMFKDFQASK